MQPSQLVTLMVDKVAGNWILGSVSGELQARLHINEVYVVFCCANALVPLCK